ncbi:hypothetical protein [Pseudomonas sp. WC2]|uniref:hypothetical protein n=1 Tax=Pseudomonas sp. WC2 TaxID=3424773 RepID=UPI003D33D463
MRAALKAAGYCLMTMFVSCGVGAQDFTHHSPSVRADLKAAPERQALPVFEFIHSQNHERSV